MTRHLTLDDLLLLVQELEVGPVRDPGLLESAAHRPTTTHWGREAYPTLDDKAAALLLSLVGSHALVDGNKRLGWLAVVVFCALNGADLDAPDDDAYDFIISIADGTRSDVADIAQQLHRWSRPV